MPTTRDETSFERAISGTVGHTAVARLTAATLATVTSSTGLRPTLSVRLPISGESAISAAALAVDSSVSSCMPGPVPIRSTTSFAGVSVTSERPSTNTKAVSCSGRAGFSAAAAVAGLRAAATSTGWRGLPSSRGARALDVTGRMAAPLWRPAAFPASSSSGSMRIFRFGSSVRWASTKLPRQHHREDKTPPLEVLESSSVVVSVCSFVTPDSAPVTLTTD